MFPCRFEGKPEDVLNPKKKQLEKITPVCTSSSIHGFDVRQFDETVGNPGFGLLDIVPLHF